MLMSAPGDEAKTGRVGKMLSNVFISGIGTLHSISLTTVFEQD